MASTFTVRAAVPPNLQNAARTSLPKVWSRARQQAATTKSSKPLEPSANDPNKPGPRRPGRNIPRKSGSINPPWSNGRRTPDKTMRILLEKGKPYPALKLFHGLDESAQLRIPQGTVSTLVAKLVRAPSPITEKNRTQEAIMPAYPWLGSRLDATLVVPATPRPLRDAENVLKSLRDIGYARTASMYEPIIKGHLQARNLQAAVGVYVELVVNWSMARAREMPEGPERDERMTSIARCKEMIAARREMEEAAVEEVRGVPLPSAELLQPILERIEEYLALGPRSDAPRRPITPVSALEATEQPLTTDRRPKGITPKESPELFWGLESCRTLSALVLHKALPFHGYHEYSPLLHTLSLVREVPRYTVEVTLPASQDYNPQGAPSWLQPRPIPHGWANITSVPHVFRPSLYLFVRTLIRVMSGSSRAAYEPLPIPGRTLEASRTSGLPSTSERDLTAQTGTGL